jgi:PrgI family protein
MATYKVIQDIEAEDKFIGPLTLKQFIFAGAAVFFGYLNFLAVIKGAVFLTVLFFPPMFLGAFLAFPWSKEQSTEIWLLAKIRFRVKPKIRIWDQSGYEELVTITVPKKIEKQLTNGLDQYEVESRLKALAETIDTRGWATKNATLASATAYSLPGVQTTTDRLVGASDIPREVPEVDPNTFTDVMDEQAPTFQNMDSMMKASEERHRQELTQKMEAARTQQPVQAVQPTVQFTPPTLEPVGPKQPVVDPIDEANIAQQLRNNLQARGNATSHLKTISTTPRLAPAQPISIPSPEPATVAETPVTSQHETDIINWSRDNNRSVESLGREAKQVQGDDEVVISLH